MDAVVKDLAMASRDDVMAAVAYLLAENQVLRGKCQRRVSTTAGERWRLERYARQLPRRLDGLISIAHPRTVRY